MPRVIAAAGHAAVLADTGDTVVRAVHLLAAGTWVGGLVFLGLAVGAARATVPDAARVAFFRALGRRFALAAALALLLLLATGSDMASDRDAWSRLGDDSYGRTLLSKLILVGAVVALTIVHSAIQGPRLSRLRERAAASPGDAALAGQIRREHADRRHLLTAREVAVLRLLAEGLSAALDDVHAELPAASRA